MNASIFAVYVIIFLLEIYLFRQLLSIPPRFVSVTHIVIYVHAESLATKLRFLVYQTDYNLQCLSQENYSSSHQAIIIRLQ